MRDRKLDRLFDRFRKRGDTAALALVFDATAPELLGIAVHLVRDVGEAEDLLQQTFLTAIEKAERYDAQRRLVPWLVGILVRHAHNARRTRARAQASEITDLPGGEDPTDGAEVNELSDSIQAALRGLPATYRAVLEPYLLRGERAVDIARASGDAPGTVRVQIRRGLDELRRALPAGLTLGTGVLLGGRSLADVRGTVLDAATKFATGKAPLAATSLSSSTLLGGLIMSNKLILGALALTAFSVLGWFAQQDDAMPIAGISNTAEDTNLVGLAPELPALPDASLPRAASSAAAKNKRVTVAGSDEDEEKRLATFMAGAHGQLVDENNQALAGVRMQLFEMRPEMFEAMSGDVFGGEAARLARDATWNPLVDETVTDADGRFSFRGASPHASQALGIDAGGARPSLRVIDTELQSGKDSDLGVIQLEAVHSVNGTLLDAQNNPIAGAHVRVASIPQELGFLASFRRGCNLLSARKGEAGFVVPVSDGVVRLLELYPLPSAQTDGEGHFEVSGVPALNQFLYVDIAGQPPLSQRLLATQEDCGTLRFPALLAHSGFVVDTSGTPIAGAQIVFGGAGIDSDSRLELVGDGECSTGADGSFLFESEASPAVFVRRDASDPWTLRRGFQTGERVVLEARHSVTVKLVDRQGEAIHGAQMYLAPRQLVRKSETFFSLPPSLGRVLEAPGGPYEVSGLQPGTTTLRVRAEGFASIETQIEVGDKGQTEPIELQMDRSAAREVRVLDAASNEAVFGATVRVLRKARFAPAMAQAKTDVDGRATLRGLPSEGEHSLSLRVTHPGYGVRMIALAPTGAGPVEVHLDSRSEALFRVTVEGREPPVSVAIMIAPGIGQDYRPSFPLMQVTDVHGAGLFEHPGSGEWTYEITERSWDTNVMALLSAKAQPTVLAEGTFTIREGLREVVDVDLSGDNFEDSLPAASGGIEGRITVRADIALTLKVGVLNADSMTLEREFIPLGANGHYRFTDLRRGSYELYVLHWPENAVQPNGVTVSEFNVQQDRMVQRDLQIDGMGFEVLTIDEQGNPVNDATIQAFPMSSEPGQPGIVSPAQDGLQTVTVWQPGSCVLIVSSPSAGLGRQHIDVSGSKGERFTVELSRGVLCAGTLTLPGSTYTGVARLNTYAVDGKESAANVDIQLTSGVGAFDILGLVPAAFQGRLMLPDGSNWSIAFGLPEGGDSGLEVVAVDVSAGSGLIAPLRVAPADD